MDANQEPTAQPCPHQDDIWDCSICGAAAFGGSTWRTCNHGQRRGECPECYPTDSRETAATE